jgi:hypothetical protein
MLETRAWTQSTTQTEGKNKRNQLAPFFSFLFFLFFFFSGEPQK